MSSPNNTLLLDGRYRLCKALDCGGSAIVWRARDERLGRTVAVKVLRDADHALNARYEAMALAQFSHPHIANVFDFGREGDLEYLVVELVEGNSLASLLARQSLAWEGAVACGAQVASALAAAHARGLVHRDVKPGNIMLTRAGVKLIDFGISAIEGEREADPAGGLRGTPAYVAPERLLNVAVSPAADVYSLGVVLFRAIAGDLPSQPGAELPAVLPVDVAEACLRCISTNPDDRPTAAELAEVLGAAAPAHSAAALADVTTPRVVAVPTRLTPELSLTEHMSQKYWRGRLVAAFAVGAVLLGTLACSATAWSLRSEQPFLSALAVPAQPCEVTYQLQADQGREFHAAITAIRRDDAIPSGWQLSLRMPSEGIVASEGWQSDGNTLTSPVQPALESGVLAQLLLSGRHLGTIPVPTGFELNGDACDATVLALPSAPAAEPPSPGQEPREPRKPNGPGRGGKGDKDTKAGEDR